MSMNTDQDIFDLPDDQVMAMSAPPAPAKVEKTEAELEAERVEAERVAAEEAAAAQAAQDQAAADEAARQQAEADEQAAAAAAAGKVDEPNPLEAADDATPPAAGKPDAKDPAAAKPPAGDPAADGAKPDAAADPNTDPNKGKVETPAAEKQDPTPEDHKAFYQRILGQPIKANGKEIQLRSPEEAERLIQMGLNYTKKMQAWQPRMRVVTMLENNGLLDEAKLGYLIDLSKGNPDAIQKLLSESKFDLHTVDADKAASYKPGNHQVSDTELAFNAALDDLESTETGVELISEVAKQWDEQSRQAVYQDPGILRVINEQKALGLYARITAEMDHLKSLGHLQGIPFLQAYRAVGDMLNEQGRLNPNAAPKQPETPVETRVATPPAKVVNNDKAAAAATTKATPVAVKKEESFLDLPDDEFIKRMAGRV